MTVSVTTNAQSYSGDGANTSFPFSFRTHNASDVKAYKISSAGVLTTLTYLTDYTVALNGDDTGTVTYPVSGSALAVGETLRLVREVAYDQAVDLTIGGAYSPSAIEDALDDQTFQNQQLAEKLGRAVVVPQGEAALSELDDAATRAGKYLGFDAVTGAPAAIAGSGAATDSSMVTHTDSHTGAVERTVKSRLQDVVHLDDFGATASDSDDDAAANVTAFTNAIASGAGTIILSAGTYRVNDTITPAIYQVIRGQGKTSTAVKMVDSVTGKPVWGIESHHIILEHFQTGWVSATQTTAHSVGIRFMDTAAGINALCGWGAFRNLRIENTYTGIDVDKSGTMAGCFSWHFEDLYIREFEESGIYNHPTGAGNSGDVYENVYIANARAGIQETGTMLDIREASSVTFNLVNLEANRMDADKPLLYLQNVTGFSINGLHIEDVDMDNHTGSDNGIIELSDKCIGVFNGIRVDGVTIPATADRLALFKIKTTNTGAAYQPRVTVDGVSIIDTTGIVPATAWNLVQTNANLSSANGARLAVRNIHTEKAFDGTVYNGDADFLWFYTSDGGDTMLMDTLRVDTEIELGDGGPKVLWGSGSPEGSVTAPIGSTFHRDDGGAGTAYYTKESGSGNTGWSAALTSGVNQLTQHGTTHTSVSSGTQISWTSIPAGVQYIRLVYFNHSASLGEDLVLTMGDSGGEETSGYYGTTSNGPSANVDWDSASNVAAEITRGAGASDVIHGCIELTLMTSNEWQISALSNTKGGSQHNASGYKALSAELTSVYLQMESGASFDGGGDYILYYQ